VSSGIAGLRQAACKRPLRTRFACSCGDNRHGDRLSACAGSQMNGPSRTAVTATTRTPTTSIHGSGSQCCCFAVMIDRVRATLSKRPRRDAHPSAAEIGRIRALTPRVRRAVPSLRLHGETRATPGQMARAGHFEHPRIRGHCPCTSLARRFGRKLVGYPLEAISRTTNKLAFASLRGG